MVVRSVYLLEVLGNQEGSTYDIGNCHILKFEYDDNQFKFIEIIDPTNNKLKPLNSYIMGLSFCTKKKLTQFLMIKINSYNDNAR